MGDPWLVSDEELDAEGPALLGGAQEAEQAALQDLERQALTDAADDHPGEEQPPEAPAPALVSAMAASAGAPSRPCRQRGVAKKHLKKAAPKPRGRTLKRWGSSGGVPAGVQVVSRLAVWGPKIKAKIKRLGVRGLGIGEDWVKSRKAGYREAIVFWNREDKSTRDRIPVPDE
ncbi:unnamed protein product [Prorocentrum cordatum]|uniref:Uncharacterized protein n=1 Tax=Prorocentrum cordatum TaxID=2364126 RepID=A0ABN9UXW4_9DINO|nr:unnamed protein product [Polarella glacialis]CAK0873455.1 unnamed protein product [Polarella glacialis]